jgi:hypothetical protein
MRYGVPNEGAVTPIRDAHPFIAGRGDAAQNQLCRLAGYQLALAPDQLRELYGAPEEYRARVARRLEELTRQGWSLPEYRDLILGRRGARRVLRQTGLAWVGAIVTCE